MLRKAQGFIKGMRALTAGVGRERELVAARIARLLHGVGHHLAANASDFFAPTVSRMFDNMARVSRGEPVREGDAVV